MTTTTTTTAEYPTFNGTNVDPLITPPTQLQAMLQSNAYRIADLVSQLEKSHAQLRRLRTRALKNNSASNSRIRKSPKPTSTSGATSTPKSPRRTRLAAQHSASPTSILHHNVSTPVSPTPNRGHWSVEEEARFDAASQKFGRTAYAQITLAVGSRTEKQVRDRAFRQRQKHFKAAEFAALSIPTVTTTTTTTTTPTPVTPTPQPQPEVPSVPITVPEIPVRDEELALSDCSTSTTPQFNVSEDHDMGSFYSRPTSPLSAVSTVETEFELALLGAKSTSTDMLDEALFQQNNGACAVTTSFDWDCSSPVMMESFCDAVGVPEFADNFLLLEHS